MHHTCDTSFQYPQHIRTIPYIQRTPKGVKSQAGRTHTHTHTHTHTYTHTHTHTAQLSSTSTSQSGAQFKDSRCPQTPSVCLPLPLPLAHSLALPFSLLFQNTNKYCSIKAGHALH